MSRLLFTLLGVVASALLLGCTAEPATSAAAPVDAPTTEKPVPYRQAVLTPSPRPAAEVEDAATSDDPSNHCGDRDYWNSRQYGDPSDYVEACGEWPSWIPEVGENACGPGLCGDEGEGLPNDEYYQEYPERQPNYQRCGRECGEAPTSGDVQGDYWCEQGMTEYC